MGSGNSERKKEKRPAREERGGHELNGELKDCLRKKAITPGGSSQPTAEYEMGTEGNAQIFHEGVKGTLGKKRGKSVSQQRACGKRGWF